MGCCISLEDIGEDIDEFIRKNKKIEIEQTFEDNIIIDGIEYDNNIVLGGRVPLHITWSDTIPFVPPIKEGLVIKVYDGDSITLAARLPIEDSPIYRFSVRLNGIDAPEMYGKTKDEREIAEIAQSKLESLVLKRYVRLEQVKTEKYGRILANVYCDGVCLNDWMIENQLAVCYDGGTKNVPKSWKKYYYRKRLKNLKK